MRFKTAAILSFILVGAMLVTPRAGQAIANWFLEHPVGIPVYVRMFLGLSVMMVAFRWILIPLTLSILFTIAVFTYDWRLRK
ncbi:MAG TPA: hypothetical protein VMU05_09855 [Dongiaceae bacterium]|nr:hypothetical protein [Dongiaceae bacterium]